MIRGSLLLGSHRAQFGEPGIVRLVEPPERALALATAQWAEEAGPAGCLYVARSAPAAERGAGRHRPAVARERPFGPHTGRVLLERVPPASLFTHTGFRIGAGMPLSLDDLRVYLLRAGYVLDERVDEAGEAALRGTIDVFPGAEEQPFRLRLEDGIVAVIDRYDPVTQRTDSPRRPRRSCPRSPR